MPWNPLRKLRESVDVTVGGNFGPVTVAFGPKKPPAIHTVVVQEEATWEQCRIVWKTLDGGALSALGAMFIAEALGTGEPYVAGQSRVVAAAFGPDERSSAHVQALNNLIGALTEVGWEPVSERGVEWYAYRFRRRQSRSS